MESESLNLLPSFCYCRSEFYSVAVPRFIFTSPARLEIKKVVSSCYILSFLGLAYQGRALVFNVFHLCCFPVILRILYISFSNKLFYLWEAAMLDFDDSREANFLTENFDFTVPIDFSDLELGNVFWVQTHCTFMDQSCLTLVL